MCQQGTIRSFNHLLQRNVHILKSGHISHESWKHLHFPFHRTKAKYYLKVFHGILMKFCLCHPKVPRKNDLENNIHSESYAISVSVRIFTIFAHACLWVSSLLHLWCNLCQDLLVSSQSFREVKVSEMKQCGRSLALRSALVLAQVTGYLCPTDMFCLANTAWTQYSFVHGHSIHLCNTLQIQYDQ